MINLGFTKIDILIFISAVIVVIAVDVALILYFNDKASDIQILSEVSQIRSGLDAYLQKNNFYPVFREPTELNDSYIGTEKLCTDGFKRYNDQCSRVILDSIPNLTQSEGNVYTYSSVSDNLDYKLEFFLKTDFRAQNLKKGKNCASNSQIISQPCF